MEEKSSCYWLRFAILGIAACGIAICALWFPYSVGQDVQLVNGERWQFVLQLLFYLITALPCFYILGIAWIVTGDIKKNKLFTRNTAKRISLASKILLIDLTVFLAGNVILLILDRNSFAVVYFFLTVFGYALAVFIAVLSHYIEKAAKLKEENEAYI